MTAFILNIKIMKMEIYLLIFFFIWLVFLSFLLIKTRRHYQHLVSGIKKKKLDEILDQIVENDKKFDQEIKKIKRDLEKVEENSKFYFQKIGFVRYNPFGDRGEQSFVLALLNEKKSGVVLNFIYTRDGLRIYTKMVKEGKGEKYQLSEEEKKAIEMSYN